MQGRNEALNAIVKGKAIPRPGTPESFKVLMRELQSLCLDIAVHKVNTSDDGSEHVEVDLMADIGVGDCLLRLHTSSISRDESGRRYVGIRGIGHWALGIGIGHGHRALGIGIGHGLLVTGYSLLVAPHQ